MSRVAQIAGICLSALAGAAAAASSRRGEDGPADDMQPPEALRDFEAVALSGPDTLLVSESDDWSVALEGDPEAIERLAIYVRDGALHVGRRHGGWPQDDDGAVVRVTLPRLTRVNLAGSGDIRAEGMTGDRIEAALAGSGDMFLSGIDAREARFSVAGSGTIVAAGAVQEGKLSIAGSGDVNADGLAALHMRVSIAGSGDAAIHADESARISLVGSGSVRVRGTDNVRVSKIGSGDVHCTG